LRLVVFCCVGSILAACRTEAETRAPFAPASADDPSKVVVATVLGTPITRGDIQGHEVEALRDAILSRILEDYRQHT
jgi:hypothetical protein